MNYSNSFSSNSFAALKVVHLYLNGFTLNILGEDGPSQMALEDLAIFRAIPNCAVFYPSDAVSCERAVELAANRPSMCYIRTSRPATESVYPNDGTFEVGKGKVSSDYFSEASSRWFLSS